MAQEVLDRNSAITQSANSIKQEVSVLLELAKKESGFNPNIRFLEYDLFQANLFLDQAIKQDFDDEQEEYK